MKRRWIGIVAVSATVAWISPANGEEKVHWDIIEKIREEGFRHSQVMDLAGYLSDVIGPRLVGSPNSRAAQEWTASKLEEFGLSVTMEPFGDVVPSWEVKYASIHMITPDYQMVIGYPKAFTPGTEAKIVRQAKIACIQERGDFDRYRGELQGAIVLTEPPKPTPPRFTPEAWRYHPISLDNIVGFGQQPERPKEQEEKPPLPFHERLEFFRSEKVAVLLEPGDRDDGTVVVDGRPGKGQDDGEIPLEQLVPILTLSAEHYNRIYRTLDRGIPVKMEIEVRTKLGEPSRPRNVIGEIVGTDLKEELVIVGAHLDSWHAGTGAADNASGCAVVMEAMRILKSIGAQPRRTIRVALWDYEEGGRHGSRAYVKEHFGNPSEGTKPAYDEFSGYFNIDVGTGQFRGLFLQEIEGARPIFRRWMEPFIELKMEKLTSQNTAGTDHLSFTEAGLPGWQFIQDEIDYETRIVHSNMDVYDKLLERDLMVNAVIMASFAYHAAMRDERLPRRENKSDEPQ